MARQTVGNNGRYRFIDLGDGDYDLVGSVENSEVARIRVQLHSPIYKQDFRQDITLEAGYLYEALKLDPIAEAEAHLRLAVLYNGAGLKDKAAAEYEEFLKKKPDYPDKKKLEQYIAANKKVSSKQ